MDRFEAYEALCAVEPAPEASIDVVNEGFLFNAILTGHTTRMRHLVDQAHEHRAGTKNAWTSAARTRPAKVFALWLAAHVLGRTIDLPQSGDFGEVVKNWRRPVDLRGIADWHLRALGSMNVELRCYQLLPVDLAAIRKVRDAEGLETIWPDQHPLVTNPAAKAWLARPKSTWSPKKDPHFPAIVKALKKAGLLPAWFDPARP